MKTKLIWSTPDAEKLMGYIARVSNPANQDNPNVGKLLKYCADHGHWSVFQHAHACVEIETTRDIGRQILRHSSFAFSEFSQRYQDATVLGDFELRECRLQDTKNRQNSLPNTDPAIASMWLEEQQNVLNVAMSVYHWAIGNGIAKEQARAILPEGLTPTRMYMTGSMRSWITYMQVRSNPDTQREHLVIANSILELLREVMPITTAAFFPQEVAE
jgi:thymidylate synthase (FAD)